MDVDTRKEAVEAFIQTTLKDHVLSEGMPRTSVDTQDAYAVVELLRSFLEKVEALEARVAAADKLAVILAVAMHEHDTADYGYGEENPWTMQEWFSDEDRAALAAYQATKEGE
jgi:hypothetical protein